MPDEGLPDIVELLTTDHDRIAELIEAGDQRAVVRELSKHLVGEDQVLYPELRRVADADDLVDAWLDSDRLLEEALLDVDKEKRTDLTTVAERFAGHRQTQEAETFPLLRRSVDGGRLSEMADALGVRAVAVGRYGEDFAVARSALPRVEREALPGIGPRCGGRR